MRCPIISYSQATMTILQILDNLGKTIETYRSSTRRCRRTNWRGRGPRNARSQYSKSDGIPTEPRTDMEEITERQSGSEGGRDSKEFSISSSPKSRGSNNPFQQQSQRPMKLNTASEILSSVSSQRCQGITRSMFFVTAIVGFSGKRVSG
jgi:hypothetical protein